MKMPSDTALASDTDYRQFLEKLKARVIGARISATRAISHEATLLYWDIGKGIVEKPQSHGWGDSVVEMVATDLRHAFPGSTSFSADKMWRMRQFFLAYSSADFLGQAVPEAPALGSKPTPLAVLGIRKAVKERELEERLISRPQAFLLELGYGFCFVGRQHRLTLGQKEYFIDLLFYHRFLKALVAFELKVGTFEPEHAGKMDFYLTLLNDQERGPEDQPSIGIILCAEKDDVEVEYALRTKTNPIGVAAYELQSKLPGELKGKLPTAKQLADVVHGEMGVGR